MDDLFSFFISLGKSSNEKKCVADLFDAIHFFAAKNGISITNQCSGGEDRIIFDLSTPQGISVEGCDIQCFSNESESIVIVGGNEWELRKAGLFDEKNINCFISRLTLFLFLKEAYQVGLISTEDTFTSLSFKEFHPGYWTIFRSDMLPEFVKCLPFESVNDQVRMYRCDQFTEIGLTPEHMGRDIRKIFKNRSANGKSIS